MRLSPRFSWFLAALLLLSHHARAYGPIGHQVVGAIADERLANSPAGVKLRSILQGYSLEKAAVIPDEIKGWDTKGVDDPTIFRYSSRPRLDAELAEFWRANPPTRDLASPIPNHHWFHYTDVPLLNGQKYADGKAGRSQWDIVQTMKLCIAVLKGEQPEDNPRKITKGIAVILLAHMLGDIHQPLHVGAMYYDEHGQPTDPDKTQPAYDHHGGNTVTLNFTAAAAERTGQAKAKFHGFWDNQAVNLNLPEVDKELEKEERKEITSEARNELVMKWAAEEPKDWRMPADLPLEKYAETWANQILPVAEEAHARLEIKVRPVKDAKDRILATGTASEKPSPDGVAYHDWAAAVAREQMHKAGWRLADLLEKALQ